MAEIARECSRGGFFVSPPPFQVQDTRCLYVYIYYLPTSIPFFRYLKPHDEIYLELEIRFVPFFLFCARAREHPRKQFQNALRGRRRAGRKLGRGREKNFLIGRIVEHPPRKVTTFPLLVNSLDSFPPAFRSCSHKRFHGLVTSVQSVSHYFDQFRRDPNSRASIRDRLDNCHRRV